jgi:hypothetical protein
MNMNLEILKEQLFSNKIESILDSELNYMYRETCDFLLTSYQKLVARPEIANQADYLLPLITLNEFEAIDLPPPRMSLQEKTQEIITSRRETPRELKLINYLEDEDDKLIYLIFFNHSNLPIELIRENTNRLDLNQKVELIDQYFEQELPLPELDFFSYTFEIYLDFQSLQELQKYELNALVIQSMSVNNGYLTPPSILDSSLHSDYIAGLKRTLRVYHQTKQDFPIQSQYLIPRSFLQKALININLNQLQKIKMSLAEDLWDKIRKVHPTIFQGIKKKFI